MNIKKRIGLMAFLVCLCLIQSDVFANGDETHKEKKKMGTQQQKIKKGWHKDHDSRHGGQFYMSPNNYNHLEGVLVSEREFRLYVYDDYTKAVSAAASKGTVTVTVKRWFSTKQLTLPLKVKKGMNFLFAPLPKGIKLPAKMDVKVTFPKSKTEERYLFEFEKVSKQSSVHKESGHK